MAATMLQSIPRFYAKISEKYLFITAKTFGKYIVLRDYCIAHHDDKTSLPVFKNHIILFVEIGKLLHKLDTFCFTYQYVY